MAVIALFMTMTASCSGDEDTAPINNEPEAPANPLPKDMVITSADGSVQSRHFEYLSTNGWSGAVNKIVYEDNSYDVLTYDNYEVTRIDRIKNGEIIEYTLLDYDQASRLIKKTRYVYIENSEEPLVYTSIIRHNTSRHVNITESSQNDPSFEHQSHSYESYSNHFVYIEDNNNNTSKSFEYDTTTRSPFLFFNDIERLKWIYPYLTDQNVVMERRYINGINAGQDRYEYIYNEENYPIEIKKYNNGSNELLETTTYTYYNM